MPLPVRVDRFAVPPAAMRVAEAIRAAGGRPILVGGWVRDRLLDIAHDRDFDIEVFGLTLARLRKVLAPLGAVHMVGRHFGVLKLTTDEAAYDVSVPRRESNVGKGHRAFLVEADPHMTFEQAAARRDFTLNAMGYAPLEGELLDPFSGERDLRAGILRHVGPAFGEDPLRVLRAMQFAGRFALDIAPETLAICREQDLHELPRERIWDEFRKLLLQAPRPAHGLAFAPALGLLRFFPELQALHAKPAAWAETLALLDAAAARRGEDPATDRVLMTAALCARLGDGQPENSARFLERLTNERPLVDAVLALCAELETPQQLHARRVDVHPGEIRRLALRQPLPLLLRAAAALHRARHGDAPFAAGAWLEAQARALEVWERPPQPMLKGRHLLERGLRPGPAIGEWVRRAFERQLDGDIACLADAQRWLDEQLHASQATGPGAGEP